MLKKVKFVGREKKFFWVLIFFIYGIPNILAFLSSLFSSTIIVEDKEVLLTSSAFNLINCIALIVVSLVFLAIYLSRLGNKFFRFKKEHKTVPEIVGVVVFFIQLLAALALFNSDYGRIGGASMSSSFVAVLVSYVNPGAIFLIYYGHVREEKIPYANLLMYIVISLAMGWSGFWLILFFIEFYYLAKYMPLKKIILRTLVVVLIGLAAYPATQAVRNKVRGTEVVTTNDFYSSMGTLLNRLQLYSNVVLLSQEASSIKSNIEENKILPFYADNQIGEKIITLLGIVIKPPSLQKYITIRYLIDLKNIPTFAVAEDFSWYAHVGVIGWLFVLGWVDIFLYLIFVICILTIPYWIAGRFIGSMSIVPVIHVISVVYLFHGWFSPQIGFIIALCVYSVIFYIGRRSVSSKNNFLR